MKYVVFENSGELDVRALSTFGCSVKVTKNPIGFFGTGMKYAIAVLLRTGHEIVIQAGDSIFKPFVKPGELRGTQFGFVHLDEATPLGFTTELGKTWEVWMAYRELHCNAKDEPNPSIYEAECVGRARPGITRIIVSGEAFSKCHATRNEFILESVPLFKLGSLEVHHQPSQNFFYKGIRVMQMQRPALYTYNQTDHVDLTEDRTVKDQTATYFAIARNILQHADRGMLERVLTAKDDYIESQFDYHGWSGVKPGPDFFPTVKALQRESLTKVNRTALRLWRESGDGFIDPRRIHPTAIQSATLEKAIAFCERSGFMLRDEYPIFIVETLGEDGTMAMADPFGKQIFLTERVFQQGGTKGVARSLIEEYLHLKFKFSDCSREMQNFLFDKLVSLAEELTGEPL